MMDNKIIANELVKIAKILKASESRVDSVIDQRELAKLRGYVDEQSYELAVEVYHQLHDDLKISENQKEAINRIKMSMERSATMDKALHRNNIFKAAHALGIKLPSSMF